MNKKILAATIAVASLCSLSGCNNNNGDTEFKKTNSDNFNIIPLVGDATDYSNSDNWMYKEVNGGHEVDLVYFYPTVTENPNNIAVSKISREMKESATYAFAETASCFAPYTNVFAPFYTQLPINVSGQAAAQYLAQYDLSPTVMAGGYLDMLTYTQVRTDVYAALDYYFEHLNNGRPFILAGHSQGSAVCQIILREYMRVHPDFLSRMVVTYSGGFAITKGYLETNTHLKYATGELDTGVIVSWTTEAPGATKYGAVTPENSVCINPLNWKTDDTYAGAELNKGMLSPIHWLHCWEIVHENLADAQIDLTRGVVVTKINDPERYPLEADSQVVGDKSYHTFDYAFYYENLKENCKNRIESYLGKEITKN